MKRILFILVALSLLFSVCTYASRNSDDIVTASNSVYNNYLQDVIGNKDDTTAGDSVVALTKGANANLTNMQNNIDTIELNVTNINTDVGVANEALTNMQNNIDIIELNVTNINTDIDVANVALTNMQNNIDIIELNVTNINTDVEVNRVLLTNMQNNVDIIETTVTNIHSDITNMQNNIDIIEVNVTNVHTDLEVVDVIVDNIFMEVVTNKVLLRSNQALQAVPGADSAENVNLGHVIGNKTDTHDGDSIYAFVETLLDHVHQPSLVFPTGEAGTNVISPNTAWAITNQTNTMVPAGGIADDFDVHYLCIEELSANGVYEISLWNMTDGNVLIGRARVVKNAQQDGTMNAPIQTPIQDGGDEIGITQVNSAGAHATVVVSLFYHTY